MAMSKDKGWKTAQIQDIPPIKDSWSKGWHSIRYYFGITGFGINAATKKKGESLTPEHDEKESGQQEVFVVMKGKVEFYVDGKSFIGTEGCILYVDPEPKRSAKALVTPTTLLIIGGAPGKVYEIAPWEKV